MSEEIKVLDKGFVRLVDHMGNDSSIVQAARVSYGKGTKKVNEDEGLIRYLLRHKHTTPFEMVQFKFHVKAPIFVFRQWHRHRMWSYNEYSGRYSEMKDEFYVPEDKHVTKQNPANKQGGSDELVGNYMQSHDGTVWIPWPLKFSGEQSIARYEYEQALKSGMRKELARINLPLAQYSEMYACVDLHNLFHFLKLRLDSHAQYEIRVYADAIGKLIRPIVPVAYKAFEDYILGGINISRKEIDALSELLQISIEHGIPEEIVDEVSQKHFTNKRENKEFLDKLNFLLQKQSK